MDVNKLEGKSSDRTFNKPAAYAGTPYATRVEEGEAARNAVEIGGRWGRACC